MIRDSRHREREFLRDRGEARRQHRHHLRHEQLAHDGQHAQPERHDGERLLGEPVRHRTTLGGEQPGEGGHERGVECTLAEQAAEQVGQLQRDEERIGDRAGTQDRRDQHVAREAQDAACHGPAADGQDAADHSSRRGRASSAVIASVSVMRPASSAATAVQIGISTP